MLRNLSVNLYFRRAVMSFFVLVGLLILLPNDISAKEQRLPRARPRPVDGCITLFKRGNESVSAQVKKDDDGCIIEKEKISEEEVVVIKFYLSSDCTGKEVKPIWEDPEPGVIYKSGIDGGCPEAVKVYRRNPTCVTLTLISGREATICW